MQIPVLMVANSASIDENNLLHVQGGGWEHTVPKAHPWTLVCHIAGIAVLEEREWGTSQVLELSAGDLAGTDPGFRASVVIGGARDVPVPGIPMRVPFAVPFTYTAMQPSVVRVSALHEGTELASYSLQFKGNVEDAPSSELPAPVPWKRAGHSARGGRPNLGMARRLGSLPSTCLSGGPLAKHHPAGDATGGQPVRRLGGDRRPRGRARRADL